MCQRKGNSPTMLHKSLGQRHPCRISREWHCGCRFSTTGWDPCRTISVTVPSRKVIRQDISAQRQVIKEQRLDQLGKVLREIWFARGSDAQSKLVRHEPDLTC